jgi:hypothetical protein
VVTLLCIARCQHKRRCSNAFLWMRAAFASAFAMGIHYSLCYIVMSVLPWAREPVSLALLPCRRLQEVGASGAWLTGCWL